ncbi:Tetratricopeptide TPR_2 repeat protein [Alicyclobacillus acidocaldarius subsp. acidocaldarius Tc-4-1]|uniref:Tetratricopeptide TPR_2 repeat protein n=1 Tax=Alicyclobacillus acidocaldarius (strain Tc-4-1) TaxID=1048834 RepID=F8ICM7_ALIAT|nr:Tetratricopeptide TPR_2 repeat protein [Alicyclobacillus acidocaldarius subsp. acidocaldarius Tc-4-1]
MYKYLEELRHFWPAVLYFFHQLRARAARSPDLAMKCVCR